MLTLTQCWLMVIISMLQQDHLAQPSSHCVAPPLGSGCQRAHDLAHVPAEVPAFPAGWRGRKRSVMWLTGRVIGCDSHLSHTGIRTWLIHRMGGRYWINGSYSAGLRVKSEGYEVVKAQLLQNGPAVMAHSAHRVAVFLLCHDGFWRISACRNLTSWSYGFHTGPCVIFLNLISPSFPQKN